MQHSFKNDYEHHKSYLFITRITGKHGCFINKTVHVCIGIIIKKYHFQWVANTRMLAMNPLHSSDQQILMTFGYLLTMTSTISYTMFSISNIIFRTI